MSLEYSFLKEEQFPLIHRAFMEAFAEYYVDTSGMTETVLYNRAIKNGVDFDLSVGVFDGEHLVGFTLVGLDRWNGRSGAYDIATGIVPSHTGRGIAGNIFDFATPKLEERKVETFVLEVIQENTPAIKAYTAAGFGINRELDCFVWDIGDSFPSTGITEDIDIRTADRSLLTEFEDHLEWLPSWENSFSSLRRIPDDVWVFGAYIDNRCAGLLVYYPLINWINTLVVKREFRRRGVATRFLADLAQRLDGTVPVVKLVNIDHSDTATPSLAEKCGFRKQVSQFEMEKKFV